MRGPYEHRLQRTEDAKIEGTPNVLRVTLTVSIVLRKDSYSFEKYFQSHCA
jgi:hypothetical protein